MDLDWLYEAYRRIRKDKASGVDGVTAKQYAADLEANLRSLQERLLSGRYVAPPVKRTYVPKEGTGDRRPIGIPTLEDKIAQRAVAMLLNPIYEQDFSTSSYGFREGRSPHQALQAVRSQIHEAGMRWVLDVDIQRYFDSLDHKHLRGFLDLRVRDGKVRKLLHKWLKAGVMEEGKVRYLEEGTLTFICITYWMNGSMTRCNRASKARPFWSGMPMILSWDFKWNRTRGACWRCCPSASRNMD